MLTPRQAFKYAFLSRCLEEGLDREQTAARIQQADNFLKSAALGYEWRKTPVSLGDIAGKPVSMLLHAALLGLGTSAVAGAGTGYLAAKSTEPQATPEEVKMQELIAAYQQHADLARRTNQRRSYRPTPPRGPRLLH